MSDSEDENFCYFGKPLDPYDEDSFPKKKPISVEEQIATDTEGRRRFHGAFTGGFSAGFFNTVGSLEGWTPSEFKSTRQDKARNITQKPEDFMDDEDFGEHGIAHKTIKATKEYSTVKKRKRQIFSDGPIPGEPVLQTLLSSGNETVGYLLLKNIGIQDKIANNQEELNTSEEKTYGCQMPTQYKIPKSIENKQYHIPKIYATFLKDPKSNTFGLGYKGLDKFHVNLFQTTSFVMKDKNDKKISIKGQAFGVGAFEDEDDDIYAKEDMSKYDFELTKEKHGKQGVDKTNLIFGIFKQSKMPLLFKKMYPPPNIPHSFTGKHKVRKSRFEPIIDESNVTERNKINPSVRAAYLGENSEKTYTQSKSIKEPSEDKEQDHPSDKQEENRPKSNFDISSILISDRFVSAVEKEDVSNILEPVQKTETLHGTKDQREAARMKMFGSLTRLTTDWLPCSVLCKRFNVPEPFMDRPDEKKKKRTKNLIFEYQKHTDNEIALMPGLSVQPKQEDIESLEMNPNKGNSSISTNTSEVDSKLTKQQNETETTKSIESELESLPKDITEKVDISEKLDLFKAVFLSSSESEDEEEVKQEDTTDSHKIEEFKANVLSDSLIPKIKPIKEGILSNVNFHPFTKPKKAVEDKVNETNFEMPDVMISEISHASNSTEIKEEVKEASYGPMLPTKRIEITNIASATIISSDSGDEWVEKIENCKKKVKHKKKHKKEKHKKHKHDKKKSKTDKELKL